MSKNNGPWGNDSPWNEPENTASPGKVIDFANIKKPGGFDFKISWIIAAVALLWLATGFYQVSPMNKALSSASENTQTHRRRTALPPALPDRRSRQSQHYAGTQHQPRCCRSLYNR